MSCVLIERETLMQSGISRGDRLGSAMKPSLSEDVLKAVIAVCTIFLGAM